jgi:hypothetical protein
MSDLNFVAFDQSTWDWPLPMPTASYWVRLDGQLMIGAMVAPRWFLDDNGALPDGTVPPRQHVIVDAPPDRLALDAAQEEV